ncbi:hypothetical protein PUNSTDRAFT_48907 [Punctularia strigosozonata HHB-11173 SS5]|uniref:uncharacterized protein n=1 Tax=Punctularia strigosozonata (strain HHB-11173) TaxID=741275 RepID=UPI0004417188|nr:uncharacterized protein PUNSTDRAFT_48907 [Punctularia strigosozonata HHB-11173 SS5]EIN14045.1 hypothetical protein PUNSTDRAFT_48907 [Punctularia strigosozonata HHB-11173 SS5]
MSSHRRFDRDGAPRARIQTPQVPSSLAVHRALTSERVDTERSPVRGGDIQQESRPLEEPSVLTDVAANSAQEGSSLTTSEGRGMLPVPSEPVASASEGEDAILHYPPTEDEKDAGQDASDASFDVPQGTFLSPDIPKVSFHSDLLLTYLSRLGLVRQNLV